ncbi:MAG: glutathione S-transferase family protein [Pseudomonadota bacterium]
MILLHHLRVGRSVFTAWLLEELGLDYDLKIYVRNDFGRAQDDLKAAHPLGKSPVIEDGAIKLTESGAIAAYLIDTYDTDFTLAPPRDDAARRAEWTQWLHYSEGSAFAPFLLKLLLTREQEPKPPLIDMFTSGEVALHLGYLQSFLADKPFLLGDKLQAPDVGLTYIMEMAERLGELGPYPTLSAYLERNKARPAFQRAMERTGG